MSDFGIRITADPGPAVRAAGRVNESLVSVEKEAADLRAELTAALAIRDTGTLSTLDRIANTLEETQTQARLTDARISQIGKDLRGQKLGISEELDDASDKANKLRSLLAKVLGGLTIGAAVREFVQLSDELTNVQNRLRIVTDSEAELVKTQQELLDVSNRTRSSFDGTATIFTRLAVSADELGRTNQQLLQFTESLNQAITLSGASAEEARAGLIQLSQGLASGALRGDELRSVLEQLPAVADVIAKSLGVTRGELRKLGEAGKITADVVLTAFEQARGELAGKFATTVPTIGQAFAVLRNTAVELVGDFNEATGASAALARGLLLVADHGQAAGAAMGVLGAALAVVTARAALANVNMAAFIKTAGPIAVIAASVALVADRLSEMSDNVEAAAAATENRLRSATLTTFGEIGAEIQKTKKELATLQRTFDAGGQTNDFAAERIAQLKARLDELTQSTHDQIAAARESTKVANERNVNVKATLDDLQHEADLLRLTADERARAEEFDKRANDLRGKGVELSAEVNKGISDELKAAILRNQQLERQAEVLDRIKGPQQAFASDLEALRALLDGNRITLAEYNTEVERLSKQQEKKSGVDDPFAKQLDSIRKANEELRIRAENEGLQETALGIELDLRRQGVELTAEQRGELASVLLEQQGLNAAIDDQNAKRKEAEDLARRASRDAERIQQETERLREQVDVQGQIREQREKLLALREQEGALAPQIDKALADLRMRELEASTSFADGFSRAIERMRAEANDLAAVGENVVNVFADQGVDAITEFAKTGKFAFDDFASAVLEDLTRILARLLIVQLISSLIPGAGAAGAASGAASAALTGLNAGRAGGGTVQPGQAPMPVGENGPELFIPNQTGTIIPSAATQAQNAKPPEVKVLVVNSDSGENIRQMLATGDFDEVLLNRINANRDKLNQVS